MTQSEQAKLNKKMRNALYYQQKGDVIKEKNKAYYKEHYEAKKKYYQENKVKKSKKVIIEDGLQDEDCIQCEINEYDNSIIYKIECLDKTITDIYVGSTTDINARFRLHKSDCHNVLSKRYNYNVYKCIRDNGGWENWRIVILELYECNNKMDLHIRERYFKNKLNASLNMYEPIITGKYISEKAKDNKKIRNALFYLNNKKIKYN